MDSSGTAEKCWCPDGSPVVFRDRVTERGYCYACSADPILSTMQVHIAFLDSLLPFTEGDRVECRTEGEHYDGKGEIIEISTEIRNGGTPIYPAYLVRLDDQQELWYTSICLTRIHERVR